MTKNRQRLGIVGGTFDPVHKGHVSTVIHAAERLSIDEIIWMPCRIPPHKPAPTSTETQRITMLNYALASLTNHTVSTWELKRPQTSYSYHTISHLRATKPNCDLFFFMGGDSLLNFTQWYRWRDIVAQCNLVVSQRPGIDLKSVTTDLSLRIHDDMKATSSNTGSIFIFDTISDDVSSSQIRAGIYENHKLQDKLHQNVYNYIVEQQLYLNVNE